MKIDIIVIGEEAEIKVRRGHREIEKKWYDRVEDSKKTYKRQKSNNRRWEDELNNDDQE